jgi:putative flippase GtrA
MKMHVYELARYGINGIVATCVHYAVLTFNLKILAFSSAGLANLVAALFGIGASFVGSRYFVFQRTNEDVMTQILRFSGLYGFIFLLHGLALFVWSDYYGQDYTVGFLLVTVVQVSLSYLGNKFLVFKA